jgi:hypothetical protein
VVISDAEDEGGDPGVIVDSRSAMKSHSEANVNCSLISASARFFIVPLVSSGVWAKGRLTGRFSLCTTRRRESASGMRGFISMLEREVRVMSGCAWWRLFGWRRGEVRRRIVVSGLRG